MKNHTLRLSRQLRACGNYLRSSYSNFYGPPTTPATPSVISQEDLEEQRRRLLKDYEAPPKQQEEKPVDLATRLSQMWNDSEKMVHFKQDYPDFLPHPEPKYRDRLMDMMEREDMIARRRVIDIPLFFVGSIMAVTVADQFGKESRFLGICIQREGHGLRHTFTLRNIIDQQGIEVKYDMYNPLLQQIEVLKLEKRLDDNLTYLRDAPQEYSFFPQDMKKDLITQKEGREVPVNTLKVKLNSHPWSQRYERMYLRGVEYPLEFRTERAENKLLNKRNRPEIRKEWEKVDLMKHYRETINPEETREIMTSAKKKIAEIAAKRQKERQLEEDESKKWKGSA